MLSPTFAIRSPALPSRRLALHCHSDESLSIASTVRDCALLRHRYARHGSAELGRHGLPALLDQGVAEILHFLDNELPAPIRAFAFPTPFAAIEDSHEVEELLGIIEPHGYIVEPMMLPSASVIS